MTPEGKTKSAKSHFGNVDFASQYDQMISKSGWKSHRSLFEEMQELVKPGQKLLDLGIGTGLGSMDYFQAGTIIHGLDFSQEMLKICEKKKIARELHCMDIERSSLPYSDRFFDLVIGQSIFFYLQDLTFLFREISRVLHQNGVFAFNADTLESSYPPGMFRTKEGDIFERVLEPANIRAYAHRDGYLRRLLEENGFALIRDFSSPMITPEETSMKIIHHTFLSRKENRSKGRLQD